MIGFITFGILAVPVLYHVIVYIMHLLSLKNYPKGLFPLPVIGNLHQLTRFAHIDFADMAKKYGNVFSISLGMRRIVVVNGYEPAKEALVTKGKAFAGRDETQYLVGLLTNGFHNITFSDYGKEWIFLRKLGHMALRTHGDGKTMNERVIRESKELINRLAQLGGRTPACPETYFGVATMNVFNSMLFGRRYEMDDEDFHNTMEMSRCGFIALNHGDPTIFLPWLRYFPLECIRNAKKSLFLKNQLMNKKIQEHERTFDPDNIRDYTDSLLDILYKKQEWHKYGIENMNYIHVENILIDILVAGYHTTLGTLRWAILYLIQWPNHQEEIYQQIMKAVGPDRKPTPEDRKSLSYLEAFIQETLRFTTHVPFTVPHKTIEETSVCGMAIPKDTTIFFNLWQINHHDRHWNEPMAFDPCRWLDEDGMYAPEKHPEFLTFSTGKRSCFGEQTARLQLFIHLSATLHEFEILPNPDEPFPSLNPADGFMLNPQPYTAIFKQRR